MGFSYPLVNKVGSDNAGLLAEMTRATKLSESPHFARVEGFGSPEIMGVEEISRYAVILTSWVEGQDLATFVTSRELGVSEFLVLAKHLLTALAVLRRARLCHDDLHPKNVLLQEYIEPLSGREELRLRIIDTGSVKRPATRVEHLRRLRERVKTLREGKGDSGQIQELERLLAWKEPDDHLRAMECLLLLANSAQRVYHALEIWERRFLDRLETILRLATDEDKERRLDAPDHLLSSLRDLRTECERPEGGPLSLNSPFDYISAELIRRDADFAELFSNKCPWLADCEVIKPLYIYGPRGCGKSSVLRWLAYKTVFADPCRDPKRDEIGVYVSCSAELRSRFWLFGEDEIEQLEGHIVQFFSLLLLQELLETLELIQNKERESNDSYFRLGGDAAKFAEWFLLRTLGPQRTQPLKLQGQGHFAFLKSATRRERWRIWSEILTGSVPSLRTDPSLVGDVCRELSERFRFFDGKMITFLLDDYSNQRIRAGIQRKLNQTISFAKNSAPLFKVSSEYAGVDLDGVQEGREVTELNVGHRYLMLREDTEGAEFLESILDLRFEKANYLGRSKGLLPESKYSGGSLSRALASETRKEPVYYHGLDTVHGLCSGDVALALELVRVIFQEANVSAGETNPIPPNVQDRAIQRFSHEEVRRLRHLVPDGPEIFDVVLFVGCIARAFVRRKKSGRQDRKGEPVCKTHLDIRADARSQLLQESDSLTGRFKQLVARAILVSLAPSRATSAETTERFQLRRIFIPAFKAPFKRDTPIKIDTCERLKLLLEAPRQFAELELKKSKVPEDELQRALELCKMTPTR